MKRIPFILAFLFSVAVSAISASADVSDEIRAAYLGFADAQNARDPDRIRSHFVQGDDFLWVSDGKTFWGSDAVIARMSSFQKADVWFVEPDLDAGRVVELDDMTALLHMPLTLVIGNSENPNRLGFLVSILFVKSEDWRIAALLTTTAKP
jgi:ketosteroid isomerase-like protein